MSYIVLARKWRPQTFDDLIGQETVATTLKNGLSSGKIAHAYLFSGPRGIGKTSTARILAKVLNCKNIQAGSLTAQSSEPCGTCQSCISIKSSASVDVLEIDGASNTSVDSVRELRETAKYSPSGGKYKIYIIDEVHMLSTPAFNALLKILEEPPPHVIFIFATTEPKKIPSTILSRCQHHSFRRVSRNLIKEHLRKITTKEDIVMNEPALEIISKAADGSIRDALTLIDQASSFSNEISDEELRMMLGLPEPDTILNLSGTILSGEVSKTLSLIKELTDRGSDLRQITRELVEHFRNIAIIKVSDNAGELLELTSQEVQKLLEHASGVTIENLTLLLSELLRLEGEVRSAINPRYTLELGLLRMSFVKGMTSLDNIMKMLERHESNTLSEEAPSAQELPAQQKKTSLIDDEPDGTDAPALSNTQEMWQKLLERLNNVDHLLACKLAEAKVVNLDAKELSIGFNGGMSVLADSVEKNSSIIKPILRELSGQNLKLRITTLPKDNTNSNMKEIRDKVFSEPLVRQAMKLFNGSMVKVKPLEDKTEDKKKQDRS